MIWCGEGSCFTKTGWLPEGFPNDSATYSKSFHFNLPVFDDLFLGPPAIRFIATLRLARRHTNKMPVG
jgi:hypothetical protein